MLSDLRATMGRLLPALVGMAALLSSGCGMQAGGVPTMAARAEVSTQVSDGGLSIVPATAAATIPAAPTAVPSSTPAPSKTPSPAPTMTPTGMVTPTEPAEAEAVLTAPPTPGLETVMGYSYEGRPITSYQFGYGDKSLVFVGGIHGGYEWNGILLAYLAIDYFLAHPEAIPDDIALSIIPNANPDGLYAVTHKEGRFTPGDLFADTRPGRFNGRGVDLNRNWDCDWAETAQWQGRQVSGGSEPFSEPESRALRDYLLQLQPELVLFWHSAADGVYAAGCPETFLPSMEMAAVYGQAAGYPVFERFDAYLVTGDAGDWLAIQGIPSISVELKSHEAVQWEENLPGMLAVLAHVAGVPVGGMP